MRKQNVYLTLWLIGPVIVVSILCAWIVLSLRHGPAMQAPPVGAGAGHTGGANALGEFLARNRTRGEVSIIVHDRTGRASDQYPLLIATTPEDTDPQPMIPSPDAASWEWQGQATALSQGFLLLWKDPQGQLWHDAEGRRPLAVTSGQEEIALTELVQ